MLRWSCVVLAGLAFVFADAAEKASPDRVAAALTEAETLAAAGKWREALAAGDRLRSACREVRGENHPDTALAELFLGEVRAQLGERSLAETHFRRALAIQEEALPSDAPELVTTLTRLGSALKDLRRFDEAAGLLRRALDLQARLHGEDGDTAIACTNLARVLRLKGDFPSAAPLLERALRILRESEGGTAPETLDGLHELALLREAAGDVAAAELATAERVVGSEAQFGADSQELREALAEWARYAEAQEHWADAEARYRRLLANAHDAGESPLVITAIAQLGWSIFQQQRFAEARPLLEQALALRTKLAGSDDPETAAVESQLGWLFRAQRDFAAAQPHFERCVAIREKALGPNDPATLESLAELGDLHWLAGNFDQAATQHERRRYRAQESTGSASAETAAATHALAIVYESAKRWTQATDAALRSLRIAEERFGPAAPETLGELLLLSRICEEAGALEPALRQCERLAAWFEQHPEASPETRAKLYRSYAIAAAKTGRAEAERLFADSRRFHETAFGESSAETLRAIGDLWTFFDQTRQPARAVEIATELAAETERALGPGASATAEVWERFGQLQLTLGDREAAAKAFHRSIRSRRENRETPPAELLAVWSRLAGLFESVRDFPRAAKLRMERLQFIRQTSVFGSAEESAACGELGLDYFRQRDFLPARGMFEHQRNLATQRGGPDDAEALAATARLGDIALAAGDLAAALEERKRLAGGCARRFGPNDAEHGRALLLLGETQLAAGDATVAGQSLGEARRILAAANASDPLLARIAAGEAAIDLRAGREDDARQLTGEALAASAAADEPMAEALTRLGDGWSARHDAATAEQVFARALDILSAAIGDQDERTLALLRRVGRLRLGRGLDGAAPLFERALAGAEALFGHESESVVEPLGWLALARLAEGHAAEAQAHAVRRLELIEKIGTADPATLSEARALRALASFRATGKGIEAVAAFAERRLGWLSF